MSTDGKIVAGTYTGDTFPPTEAGGLARDCLCGCGGQPRGKKSRYLPGHDAKHRSQLLRRVRVEADRGAANELVRLGWLTPSAAAAEVGEELARDAELKAAV